MEIFKDKKIKKIIEKIKKAIELTKFQGKVYVTGGCIRDSIMGLPIKDVDLVVESPNGALLVAYLLTAKENCYNKKNNPISYGNSHTVMIRFTNDEELKNIKIELTQTMKKHCSKYDRVEDCFGTVEEDSKLRDLTINAFYYDISNGILHDYNNGVNDLKTMTLRTPHNPSQLFAQDPIKMLRIIKMSSELGWGIEKNTWFGILYNRHFINEAPQEKIGELLSQILVSQNASSGLAKMYYCGLLKEILPDIHDLNSVYESQNLNMTTFDHTLKMVATVQPFIVNRLAALFHDIGNVISTKYQRVSTQDAFSADVAMSILYDMKFPHEVICSVGKAIRYHRAFDSCANDKVPSDKKIRKFVNNCGDALAVTVDLMSANNLCGAENKPQLVLNVLKRIEELNAVEEANTIKLPIDGNTLMKELGIKGGPIIGNLLSAIKDAYLENPKITQKECIKIAKKQLIKLVK